MIRRIAVLSAMLMLLGAVPSGSAHAGKSPGSGPTYTPMAVQSQNYTFATSRTSCLGEDDSLQWAVAGDLQPGQSYTFTPSTPDCAGHITAITTALSWSGSQLRLSSVVPQSDFTDGDPGQAGTSITAPAVGSTAALCMFPAYSSSGPDTFYSITVTNIGATTATNVSLDGTDQNDWISNFYYRCINADADHDGWNDSFEHAMAILTYYAQGATVAAGQGTDYLRSAGTGTANDEFDFYPPDLNDDGVVDQTDVNLITGQVGQGDGVPLSQISPNPGDATYLYNQTLAWRRYDVNGDGYIDQHDVNVVKSLVGKPIPGSADTIPPFADVTMPANGATVAGGSSTLLGGYAWDNQALTKVEFYANGSLVCTTSSPGSNFRGNPLFRCSWSVPKRAASYSITAKAYDEAGNTYMSAGTTVNSS